MIFGLTVYLYNENMWDDFGSFQIHGIISIQFNLCQHSMAKYWSVYSVCPLLKSASRSNISGKREHTQPCYMYSGNTPSPFRQKLGNNPRLKLLSVCIFLSLLCISHLLSTHYNYFMPSQLLPKHPMPDHLGYVRQIVSVTLCSIMKNNVWGFIYFFILRVYFSSLLKTL